MGTRLRPPWDLLNSSNTLVKAETCDREYEKPLRGHLDEYRTVVAVGRLPLNHILHESNIS
jgi:hypothetical protein